MPNDAKLGLVIGVGLVIAVAVVFFRKDLASAKPTPAEPSTLAASPAPPTGYARVLYRPVKATTADRTEASPTGQQHTVEKGDTLFSLAQQYYGDKDKFIDIYGANREVVTTPDELTPGTVLVIPELSEEGRKPPEKKEEGQDETR